MPTKFVQVVDRETGELIEEDVTQELEALAECESAISNDIKAFVRVGEALLKIRDNRLYRFSHRSFEDYCREQWNLSRPRVYQLMGASTITANLSTNGGQLPDNERQIRALAELTPEEQLIVWQVIADTAPNGKITSTHTKSIVNLAKEVLVTSAIDNGQGVSVDVHALFKAAVMEETYERTARQRGHILEGMAKKQQPHVANNSGENEWYTPPEFITAARLVMGSIELDPASTEIANTIVRAARYYTIEDNGLLQSWIARTIWMNPPYGKGLIEHFATKLVTAYDAGDIQQACVLTNNATETVWFNDMLQAANELCLVRGRIKFLDQQGKPTGEPLQGQTVLYFGENTAAFREHFGVFGEVLHVR